MVREFPSRANTTQFAQMVVKIRYSKNGQSTIFFAAFRNKFSGDKIKSALFKIHARRFRFVFCFVSPRTGFEPGPESPG